MICSWCGGENPTDAAFCGECGRQLGSVPSAASGPAPGPASGPSPVMAGVPVGAAAHTSAQAATEAVSAGAGSEPTRYLCAAVQMDENLSNLLINGILRQEHRSVAASPDLDLVTVFRHAIAANNRRRLRDATLFVLLVLAIVLLLWGRGLLPVLFCYLLALVVVVGEQLHTRHEVLAGTLSRGRFQPTEAPDPPSHLRPALRRVASHGTGNVTVYSGYSPFVGYGAVLDSWSFALDIGRPAEGRTTVRGFTVEEIHDHIAARVGELALPGMEVTDRLFVNGLDIRRDTRFLPDPMDRPVDRVVPDLVRRLMVSAEDRARPYLTIRVVGWRGELALSVFCRFMVNESILFAEVSYSLLTPLREVYRTVDRVLPTPTVGEVAVLVGRSFGPTAKLTLASPAKMVRALYAPLSERTRQARQRRQIERNPFFDYGSLFSPREAASDNAYDRYFQRLDSELYRKVVERRILDSMVAFLDEHDIDTGDLVERQTTILNQGVMVTGQGTLNAQNVAAGSNARAQTNAGSTRSKS